MMVMWGEVKVWVRAHDPQHCWSPQFSGSLRRRGGGAYSRRCPFVRGRQLWRGVEEGREGGRSVWCTVNQFLPQTTTEKWHFHQQKRGTGGGEEECVTGKWASE